MWYQTQVWIPWFEWNKKKNKCITSLSGVQSRNKLCTHDHTPRWLVATLSLVVNAAKALEYIRHLGFWSRKHSILKLILYSGPTVYQCTLYCTFNNVLWHMSKGTLGNTCLAFQTSRDWLNHYRCLRTTCAPILSGLCVHGIWCKSASSFSNCCQHFYIYYTLGELQEASMSSSFVCRYIVSWHGVRFVLDFILLYLL